MGVSQILGKGTRAGRPCPCDAFVPNMSAQE